MALAMGLEKPIWCLVAVHRWQQRIRQAAALPMAPRPTIATSNSAPLVGAGMVAA
jgi:hypothetical protein